MVGKLKLRNDCYEAKHGLETLSISDARSRDDEVPEIAWGGVGWGGSLWNISYSVIWVGVIVDGKWNNLGLESKGGTSIPRFLCENFSKCDAWRREQYYLTLVGNSKNNKQCMKLNHGEEWRKKTITARRKPWTFIGN